MNGEGGFCRGADCGDDEGQVLVISALRIGQTGVGDHGKCTL